jgi:hypothetical protein
LTLDTGTDFRIKDEPQKGSLNSKNQEAFMIKKNIYLKLLLAIAVIVSGAAINTAAQHDHHVNTQSTNKVRTQTKKKVLMSTRKKIQSSSRKRKAPALTRRSVPVKKTEEPHHH